MNAIVKRTRYILFKMLLLLLVSPAIAQDNNVQASRQLKQFYSKLADINLTFTLPEGFKELKVADMKDFQYDYAMEIPGKDFEIWIQVNTKKSNEKLAREKNIHIVPDSLYASLGQLQATAFSDDKAPFARGLPSYILARYNADAGKVYMLNLKDMPETKHYKYALLTILQKNSTGTVSAICFTNERGADFFKNLNYASNCLKFKPD